MSNKYSDSLDDEKRQLVKRLNKAFFESDVKTKIELKEKMNVSYNAVMKWFQTGLISNANLKKLAVILNSDYGWLIGIKDISEPIPAYDIKPVHEQSDLDNDDIMINLYDVELSAGSGSTVPEFVETKKQLSFSLDWIERKNLKAENLKLMKVKGDSMTPVFNNDDMVLIDTSQTNIIDGKVYALVIGQEAKIKRLKRSFDGGLVIMSDNNSDMYSDEIISPKDMQFIHVIGLAVHRSGDI